MAEIFGHLPAVDAAILDKRLRAVANTVCHLDARTSDQRRADALIALAESKSSLECQCGLESCTATAEPGVGEFSQVVIHVLAERATLDGTSDKPAYVLGQGPIPAETVQDMVNSRRAKVRPVPKPDEMTAERGYRPSRKLADFILSRDLTCRFPSCDRPADHGDVDHTVPWPYGSTHPSDVKAYCRFHHLMKTFWGGPGGWNDTQQPDDTITLTSPSGRTYTTTPLGAWLFPQLATPTGTAPATIPPEDTSQTKTRKMPRRRRTRAAERHARITAERDANIAWRLTHPPPY